MIEFGGWEMPVSYTDITTEHKKVRTAAGLFDLCHMGRVAISGPDAERLVQNAQTNDLARIPLNKIRYAMLLFPHGGVIDDILVHRRPHDVFLVINAGNREADVAQLRTLAKGLNVVIDDQSDTLGMIAVQGPKSAEVVKKLTQDIDVDAIKYYSLAEGTIDGAQGMITRTGYTGEDGFELYVPVAGLAHLWNAVLEAGRPVSLTPCGLGARDTLRLEAGMPLYGHEITAEINPIEADLMFGVRLEKPAFVGRDALVKVQTDGPKRKLVGLVIEGKRIPRQGYGVLADGREAGTVASGTWSPTFERAIATALIDAQALAGARSIAVDVRGKPAAAKIVELPFYKRDGSGSLQKS
jgi:aminomethyltransferase